MPVNGSIHNENDPNFDGPGPLGWRTRPAGRTHLSIPVIHRLLDENGAECFQTTCVCGFESAPFVDVDVAMAEAWLHQFPGGRISDLRRYCATHDTEAADNGAQRTVSSSNGSKDNNHDRTFSERLDPCAFCGQELRPSNMSRHIAARHSSVIV